MPDNKSNLEDVFTWFGAMSAQQVMDELIRICGTAKLLDYLHSKEEHYKKSPVEDAFTVARNLQLIDDFYKRNPDA